MWMEIKSVIFINVGVVCVGCSPAASQYTHVLRGKYRNTGSFSIVSPLLGGGYRIYTPNQFPWHAGLYTKTRPYKQICGGTIVATNVVITAAHCVWRDEHMSPASNFAVAVGKIYRPWNEPLDETAQKSDIKEIKIPPRYQEAVANFQEDIAVLILFKHFMINDEVRPACVSFDPAFEKAQLKEGQLGKVAGWGLTSENSEASQVLQAAFLPSVSIDKCIEQSPVRFRSAITGDKICAGYNNGTAVCSGDSGGGLVFPANWLNLKLWFIRGVVSTAPTTENKCNLHSWATFTHLLKHEHFLKSVVPNIDTSCEMPPIVDVAEFHTGETGPPGNDSCSCKTVKPYQVEYEGETFSLHL